MAGFPEPQPGVLYLTEGGPETELMESYGHEPPELALYPLLDDRRAVADLTEMYTRYLEVAAAHGFVALMGGLDWRASPHWAAKLEISREALAEFQLRSIEFLREVARPFARQIPQILIAGVVGPSAYRCNEADEAEEYHGVQIATLREADVDLVSALTFESVPEAIGVARAAARAGLPLSMSFTVSPTGRLATGPTLQEAIETVDEQAGVARPDFYGINCAHPIEFAPALHGGACLERIRSLRPNATPAGGRPSDPDTLGAEMGAIADRLPHIDVWGGCCGTWDEHLRAIAEQLRLQTPA